MMRFLVDSLIRKSPTIGYSLAKEFFRVDRKAILLQLSSNKMFMLPKRLDNIVYFANEFIVHDPSITALIPQRLKERLELALASIKT